MVEPTEGIIQDKMRDKAHRFLRDCARAMALCAETAQASAMVERFSNQLDNPQPRTYTPSPLPVLSSLDLVVDMKLAKRFCEFAASMPWKPSHRTVDQGREVALLDFNQVFDLGSIVSGMMYVDANRIYPEHNHEPEEIYFLLSGTAAWRFGGHDQYQIISAGNLLYNHPRDVHGIRAGPTPVLALYLQCL
jgi:mannose-6-phosphate isomerase-like protein (cupin superfamily)